MKIVAKCSAFVSLSYQVQVKVCNPIPLILGGHIQYSLGFFSPAHSPPGRGGYNEKD